MTQTSEWLPAGTVVMLEDGERPIMVAGFMIEDAVSGKYWDYVGYPYPEGAREANTDYFFDRSMVKHVLQVGFLNDTGLAFQDYLASTKESYEKMRRADSVKVKEA